jgi:hypothetical protein
LENIGIREIDTNAIFIANLEIDSNISIPRS